MTAESNASSQLSGIAPEAQRLISDLDMQPIPEEGGWFALGPRTPQLSTVTVVLADTPDGFSAFHQLTIDEGWQHLDGDPVDLHLIAPDGAHQHITLGPDHPQALVRAGTWQAARPVGRWAQIACWCSPQFTDDCFTIGDRQILIAEYPAHADVIAACTRHRAESPSS